MSQAEHFMARALELATEGLGRTSPNPMVGAVLVKEGRIIGEGYHRRAGLAHAEIEALQAAGSAAEGATLYVNLEPCCHWGRTPPCTQALIRARVAELIDFDASSLAMQAGSFLALNMVMLGALGKTGRIPFSDGQLKQIIRDKTKESFLEMNLKAFELGYAAVS